jgi:hypothetical protein
MHNPEELDGPAVSALRRAIAEVKQHWLVTRADAPQRSVHLSRIIIDTYNRYTFEMIHCGCYRMRDTIANPHDIKNALNIHQDRQREATLFYTMIT